MLFGVLVLYLGVISFYVGGPGKLLEWEVVAVGAGPDGTEGEIGGGWILEFSSGWTVEVRGDEEDPLMEGVRPPAIADASWDWALPEGERYCDFLASVQYRRRRIQRWLPVYLLGID